MARRRIARPLRRRRRSAELKDRIILTARYATPDPTGVAAEDKISLTSRLLDLDVDSNNDGTVAFDDEDEDKIECLPHTVNPGMLTTPDSGDADGDGVTDSVDFQVESDEPLFKEVVLRLDGPVPPDSVVKISYFANVPPKNEGGKLKRRGALRLWTKPASETRNPKSLKKGGDFVAPSKNDKKSTWYTVEELFGSKKRITLHLETVRLKRDVTNDNHTFKITVKVQSKKDAENKFSLIDEVRVNPMLLQFVTKGKNNSIVPTDFVGVCNPRPEVRLEKVTKGDIVIRRTRAVVKLSGTVLDPVADNMPEGVGEVESVQAFVDGVRRGAARNVAAVDGGKPSFWRQHPYKGEFKNLKVRIPLEEGTRLVRVETSANAAELTGFDEIAVTLRKRIKTTPGTPPTTLYVNIHMPDGIKDSTVDEIKYYFGRREPNDDDPIFAENDGEPASSVFHGKLGELDARIEITEFDGLDPAKKDVLTAKVPIIMNGSIVETTLLFTETRKRSKLFRASYTLPGTPPTTTVTWRVAKVANLNGSGKGTYFPFTTRIKGLSNPDKHVFDWNDGHPTDLTRSALAGGSWLYPLSGSERIGVARKNGNKVVIFYCDDDGKITKCSVKNLKEEAGIKTKDDLNKWVDKNSLEFRDVAVLSMVGIIKAMFDSPLFFQVKNDLKKKYGISKTRKNILLFKYKKFIRTNSFLATFIDDGPTFLGAHGSVFFKWKNEDIRILADTENEKTWKAAIYSRIEKYENALWRKILPKIKKEFEDYVRRYENTDWHDKFAIWEKTDYKDWKFKFQHGKIKVKYLTVGSKHTYEFDQKLPPIPRNNTYGSTTEQPPPYPIPIKDGKTISNYVSFDNPVKKIYALNDLYLKAIFSDRILGDHAVRVDMAKGVAYDRSGRESIYPKDLLTRAPQNHKTFYWLRCHPFFTREFKSKGVQIRFPSGAYEHGKLSKGRVKMLLYAAGFSNDVEAILNSAEFKNYGIK